VEQLPGQAAPGSEQSPGLEGTQREPQPVSPGHESDTGGAQAAQASTHKRLCQAGKCHSAILTLLNKKNAIAGNVERPVPRLASLHISGYEIRVGQNEQGGSATWEISARQA